MPPPTKSPSPTVNHRNTEPLLVSGSRGTREPAAIPPLESPDRPRRPSQTDEVPGASSTQGTGSADVTLPLPELPDHLCGSTEEGSTARTPGSRGPVSAEAFPTPELADNPRRRGIASTEEQGTHKGNLTRTPMDEGQRKEDRMPGTDKGHTAYSPVDHEGPARIASIRGASNDSNPETSPGNAFFPAVGPCLPSVDETLPPTFGEDLDHSGCTDISPILNTSFSFSAPDHGVMNTNNDRPADQAGSPTRNNTEETSDGPYPTPALPKPLNFLLQWNINGFFGHLAELEILCQSDSPWIIALQEVNKVTTDQLNRTLGGRYEWYYKRCGNFRHSVAIGVLRGVPHQVIDLQTDLPIVGVHLKNATNLTIGCAYLPCGRLTNLEGDLTSAISQLPEPRIIVGDFNGHHPDWGSPRPDPRGSILANIFEGEDLVVLNNGSPTFFNGRHTTAIDIATASRSIADRAQWNINNDLHGSDHYPIRIQLSTSAVPLTTRRPRWRYEKAEWDAFREISDALLSQRDPNDISSFTDILYEAATVSIPRTGSVPGRKALRWWNDDTKCAVKARRKALRRLKRLDPNDPGREEALRCYRERHLTCRQVIRDAKRSSWMEFLDSIDESQSSRDLWNRVNALSGKRGSTQLTIQAHGTTISEPKGVADELGNYFAELSAVRGYDNEFSRRVNPSTSCIRDLLIPSDVPLLQINEPFTFRELDFALACSSGKSAGPDEVGYPLLKNLSLNGKTRLLALFNDLWLTDSYPDRWRQSLVVPIPKNNAGQGEPSSFRPIALTCCAAKVMERMVNRRLREFLESSGRLDDRQHAFRQGRGSSTYFAALGKVLKETRDNGHHAELVSLDISKAFNRTWTPGVIRQLIDWGLAGHITHFVRNFLLDRTFQVTVGNTRSDPFSEETGVPQGSVIAVTLFLVAMNGVFSRLPKNVHVIVYADDILIVVTGRTTKRTRNTAQAAVSAVSRWAISVGFQLSAPKSVRCHICHTGHRVREQPITIQGNPIPLKKTVRVLGVTLDRTLNFDQHFKTVKDNCRSRINIVKTISRPHRSNNRETRLRVASAIIDSRLFYGLEITCLATEKLNRTLAPIYNTYVRIISGLLPSTPADAACVEIGILPFRYRTAAAIAMKAAALAAKISGNHRVYLLNEGNRALRTVANVELPPVARVHWHGEKSWRSNIIKIDKRIKRGFQAGDNSVALRRSVAELLGAVYPEYVHRFTDGSRSRIGVGLGVAGPDMTTRQSLPDACSVFSAEAAAVLDAAVTPAEQPILVLTDSHSVIQALEAEAPSHPWIQAITRYAPPSTVFTWIPGHCGVPGNEAADKLAGSGASGPRYTTNVPLLDVRRWTTNTIWEAWQKDWLQSRSTLLRKVKESTRAWQDSHKYRDQKIISRLRTGHARISYNFGGTPFRKICQVCSIPASVEHVLCVCPEFQHLREQHGLPENVRDLLGNDPTTLAALIAFLKDAHLYHLI